MTERVTECREEAGATTVVVLALAFALVIVGWGCGSVVAVVVAHRSAQNAADLAALAAAQHGCSAAAEVASANEAHLLVCETDGVAVSVEVGVAVPLTIRPEVRARARAGPS